MKYAHLKLFLIAAIFAGIANVDSIAITNIASIDIGSSIPAIDINANQKGINLIRIGRTIEADNVIKTIALDPSIVAADISPIAADLRIESRVAVKDIDFQTSLPIIL